MVKISIQYPEHYSRKALLFRTFLGAFYIYIPHGILLALAGMLLALLWPIAFIIKLVKGRLPEGMRTFIAGVFNWRMRILSTLMNLTETYPVFGVPLETETVSVELLQNENISFGKTLLVGLFGWLFVGIPHGFILYWRSLASLVIGIMAFWTIMVKGTQPKSWQLFNKITIIKQLDLLLYLFFVSNQKPMSGRYVDK